MIGLFESLWKRDQLSHLNVFAVNSLFTGMIQVSAEMRVTNPVLVANAMRRFDTAHDVLRCLAKYWLNAEVILKLFEESPVRLRNELRLGRSSESSTGQSSSTDTRTPRVDSPNAQADAEVNVEDFTAAPTPQVATSLDLAASTDVIQEELNWNLLYWETPRLADLDNFI